MVSFERIWLVDCIRSAVSASTCISTRSSRRSELDRHSGKPRSMRPCCNMANSAVSTNHILAALPAHELARLDPHLERMPLDAMALLYDANQPIDQVYFPESATVSLVNVLQPATAVETAMVGR